MNMTFDNLEAVVTKMLNHINAEIQHSLKDEQYFNRETLIKVCRVRDGLSLAELALIEINKEAE